MEKIKNIIIILITLFVISIIFCGTISAASPVSTYKSNKTSPDIFANKVVWSDDRNVKIHYTDSRKNNNDIYIKDIYTGKETQITTNTANQEKPAIYGNIVVWQDNRNGNYDIYMKNLATGKESPVTTESHHQMDPDIYGNIIVWADYRNGNSDIYMKDLSNLKETRITTHPSDQSGPVIYGNRIVWTDPRNDYSPSTGIYEDTDIYMYDITTGKESAITTALNFQTCPSIYDTKVVYRDLTGRKILMKDLSKGTTSIVCSQMCEAYTSIYGNYVIWNGFDDKVYMKNIITGTETKITSDITSYKLKNALWGNRVVWEEFNPSTHKSNIYMYTLPFKDLSVTGLTIPSSVYRGSNVKIKNAVKNYGNTAIANTFIVRFYLSKDSSIGTGDIYLGYRVISSLTAGTTNVITSSLTVPSNTAIGSYYICAWADASNKVVESVETNNKRASNTKINILTHFKDVTITSLALPYTGIRGSRILVTDTVKNNGNLLITIPFVVKYYLSTNTVLSSTDYYIGQRTIKSLSAGAINSIISSLRVPFTVPSGNYYLCAWADGTNKVVELYENNNIKTSSHTLNIKSIDNNIPICRNAYDQKSPDIYGDNVVWMDKRNGNWDIYIYNLTTKKESAVCTNQYSQSAPKIYGNWVVWWDMRGIYSGTNTGTDIYGKNLLTGVETVICNKPGNQDGPSIYGNTVVWQDDRSGQGMDIYKYDLTTKQESQLTTNHQVVGPPSIYGSLMVWPDFSYGNNEILMMNITTKTVTRITNNPYRQEWPDIYNNIVVWADYRNGNSDIYMKDIITGVESRITSNSMNQDIPKIYGSKIVYNNDRNGNADIYLYNLVTKSETRLTPSTQNQYNPQIYGNNIVWDDMINGNSDIYQYLIDSKAPTVSASPVGGIYYTPKIVTLTLNEAGIIYYTTNGTTPSTSSSRYINPIIISNTKYLKYFAIDVSNNKSNVYTQKYTIK